MRVREQRAHGTTEKDNIVSSLDWLREGRFVAIQTAHNTLEKSRRATLYKQRSFIVAIELEERREERQDECKGDLESSVDRASVRGPDRMTSSS